MNSDAKDAGRRTLLQRGLALLGGGVAVVAGAKWNRAEAAAPPPAPVTLTLYARKRPVASHTADTRVIASGDLFDTADGRTAVGAFYTNCFCLGTPFGPHTDAGANLEFQVLHLKEGTLFGISGGGNTHGEITMHAIVGGTSRYAGARGSYVERPPTDTAADPDLVEFVVTLA